MKTVAFPHSASLATTTTATPRPEGTLSLIGNRPNPDVPFGYVLVDSGADYVVLPEKAGLLAGIAVPAKPTTTLHGVGGSVGAALVRGLALEFQSLRLTADALTGGVVEALGLDEGEGNVAVERAVVSEVDALLAALAEDRRRRRDVLGDQVRDQENAAADDDSDHDRHRVEEA